MEPELFELTKNTSFDDENDDKSSFDDDDDNDKSSNDDLTFNDNEFKNFFLNQNNNKIKELELQLLIKQE